MMRSPSFTSAKWMPAFTSAGSSHSSLRGAVSVADSDLDVCSSEGSPPEMDCWLFGGGVAIAGTVQLDVSGSSWENNTCGLTGCQIYSTSAAGASFAHGSSIELGCAGGSGGSNGPPKGKGNNNAGGNGNTGGNGNGNGNTGGNGNGRPKSF